MTLPRRLNRSPEVTIKNCTVGYGSSNNVSIETDLNSQVIHILLEPQNNSTPRPLSTSRLKLENPIRNKNNLFSIDYDPTLTDNVAYPIPVFKSVRGDHT